MNSERIEQLLMKNTLNKKEKAEIEEAAKKEGITYTIKQNCKTCWQDLLLKLFEHCPKNFNVSKDGYRFKVFGRSFKLLGVIYDNENIKDKYIGKLHPNVIKTYFVKVESDEQNSDL